MDPGTPRFSGARAGALIRAHLHATRASASLVASGLTHGFVAAVLCGILAGEVGPFVYTMFAFTLTSLLLTLPFFGELGFPMRGEGDGDWLRALPATDTEHRLAKLAVVLMMLLALAGPPLAIAAWFLPEPTGAGRVGLLLAGLGCSAAWIGGLTLLQSLLLGRSPALWNSLQALLAAGSLAGVLLALPLFASFGDRGFDSLPALTRAFPPSLFAWVAASIPPSLAALGLGLMLFAISSLAPAPRLRGGTARGPMELLLEGPAWLAERTWVRRDERGVFRFLLEALPGERELRLRTLPLLGVPLAFLWVAAAKEPGPEKDGLLALILFTPGFYLPVLASQTSATSSPGARWLLETHPTPLAALENGWLKAVAVRYLLPLHVALGLVAWQQSGLRFALTLALPALLVSLLSLRALWRKTLIDLPLSREPDRTGVVVDLGGPLLGAGFGLAVVAVLASEHLESPLLGLLAAFSLSLLELIADHHWRSGAVSSGQTTP